MKTYYEYLNESSLTVEQIKEIYDKMNRLVFDGKLPQVPFVIRQMKNNVGLVSFKYLGRTPFVTEFAISKNYDFTPEQLQRIVLHEMIHVWEVQNNVGLDVAHGRHFEREMERIKSMGYDVSPTEKSTDLEIQKEFTGKTYTVVRVVDEKSGDVFMLFRKFDSTVEEQLKSVLSRHAKLYGAVTIRIYRGVSDQVFDKMKFATSINGALSRQYVLNPEHRTALENFDYEEVKID